MWKIHIGNILHNQYFEIFSNFLIKINNILKNKYAIIGKNIIINKTPGLAGVEIFKVLYYEQLRVKHLQYKYN